MTKITATCPECSHKFPLDQVLAKEISKSVEEKSRVEIEKREKEIIKLKTKMEETEAEFEVSAKKLADAEVKKALKEQDKRLRDEVQVEIAALEEALSSNSERLTQAQKNELEMRKRMNEVEQRAREIDLEVERKLSEQVGATTDRLTKQIAEDFHRKDMEREHIIGELRKQLVEMKQKAEQGSQQTQGEVFEDLIGTLLRAEFPEDNIEDVPTGVCGADLIQTVVTRTGLRVGQILWEIKQAKVFQPSWLEKLKNDRNDRGAELAILVTAVMPKGKKGAFLDQGIWIVEPAMAASVARVARQCLIDIHRSVVSSTARQEKADILYAYLTNPVFRQRLEAIVECFHQMREDLEREKRAISKTWKQRARQLDSVVDNTMHIYTDIQSVVGQKVFNIQLLELPAMERIEVVQNE